MHTPLEPFPQQEGEHTCRCHPKYPLAFLGVSPSSHLPHASANLLVIALAEFVFEDLVPCGGGWEEWRKGFERSGGPAIAPWTISKFEKKPASLSVMIL